LGGGGGKFPSSPFPPPIIRQQKAGRSGGVRRGMERVNDISCLLAMVGGWGEAFPPLGGSFVVGYGRGNSPRFLYPP
jgi:hypothetical protein